ncbi:hypothetical protein [Actinomadura sp. NTSP31]|uniref:Vgb family protein n=1 Tax=Actinomadura sp. NTSP31 TaxID=1735447 RepID=UPI0035C1CD7D
MALRHRGLRHRGRTAAALAAAALLVTGISAAPAGATAVGEEPALIPDSAPLGLTVGTLGSIWYTAHAGSVLGRDTAGIVTEYKVGANSQGSTGVLEGMASASDGTPWFTDASTVVPRVGKVNVVTGKATVYEVTDPLFAGNQITDITRGPDGNMWFTGNGNGAIGRVTSSGSIKVYDTNAYGLSPYAITTGSDKALWFTDTAGGAIGRIDPSSGAISAYYPPSSLNGFPATGGITAGPDGALWFTEPGVGKVGRVTTAGAITEYAPPTANAAPEGIVTGSDGNLWFTEAAAGNVAKITPAGKVTEYPLPSKYAAPMRIISAPSGKLWFTQTGRNALGSIDPKSPPSGSPNPAITPIAAGSTPRIAAAYQARCPLGSICETQVNTGGHVGIGSFGLDMPAGAIRVTGYVKTFNPDGTATLQPPLSGSQFESVPVVVPGGLIGTLPGIGTVLGMTADALLPFNRLTVSQTLSGPITVRSTGSTFEATATVTIHLNNTLLGSGCTIGPVTQKLNPVSEQGGAPQDPQLGWQPQIVRIKDNTFTVPAAKGCGLGGILNGLINSTIGLPSTSGQSSIDLPAVLSIGGGAG